MGIRKRQNGKLEYRFQWRGRRYQVATDLEDTRPNRKSVAAMERDHRNRLAIEKGVKPPSYRRSFTDAVEEFREWATIHYAAHPSTAVRLMTSLASAVVFFGSAPIGMIRTIDVEDYGAWRKSQHQVKAPTLRNDYRALSVLFKWAMKRNLATENPVKGVEMPAGADAIRQHVVSEEDERRYFAVARGNLRDVARLMLLQGVRPGEVLALRKKDFCDGCYLTVGAGKTPSARRRLLLLPESIEILERRMKTAGPWLFPSTDPARHIAKVNGSHDRVLERTGLNIVLYDFRHTFATRAAEAGVPAFALAAILGHSTTAVLHRYVHPLQKWQDEGMRRFEKWIKRKKK